MGWIAGIKQAVQGRMSANPEQLEKLFQRVAELEKRVAELDGDKKGWVRLSKWCKDTGETKDTVYSRRYAGKWADGIHCELRDGRLWINYPEADKWRKKNQNTSH